MSTLVDVNPMSEEEIFNEHKFNWAAVDKTFHKNNAKPECKYPIYALLSNKSFSLPTFMLTIPFSFPYLFFISILYLQCNMHTQ